MTRWEAFRIFRGEFLRMLGRLAVAPLIIAITGLATGHVERHLIETYGALIWLVIVLAAGSWAAYQSALQIRDDYEHSYPARRAKAYRVFYQLLREGERHLRGNPRGEQRRTEWDLKVRRSLEDYCISERLSVYLLNTGNREQTDSRLEYEHVAYAVGFLRELLDRDFSWGRPLIK